jgi:hypothetical protein
MPKIDTSTRPASRTGIWMRRPSVVSATTTWRRSRPSKRANGVSRAPLLGCCPRCPRSLSADARASTRRRWSGSRQRRWSHRTGPVSWIRNATSPSTEADVILPPDDRRHPPGPSGFRHPQAGAKSLQQSIPDGGRVRRRSSVTRGLTRASPQTRPPTGSYTARRGRPATSW